MDMNAWTWKVEAEWTIEHGPERWNWKVGMEVENGKGQCNGHGNGNMAMESYLIETDGNGQWA